MPLCHLYTNIARNDIPKDFTKEFIKIISDALGRPNAHVTLTIIPDCIMTTSCTDGPCAQLSVTGIDLPLEAESGKYIAAIDTFVSKMLNIPLDRVVIVLSSVKPYESGIGDKSLAQLKAEADKKD
ncbi:hypothetical protein LOD99_4498 [Oopsacas minuta]|uniref:D-dopachrome decarboxylase n=1 Tax=Oopsacas minuta TaxID=111878 RepID=A0AAV7JT26_9METZ|nr:hypothetical protein LOD99_4497 [Oopsacas minuta]KAI6651953.1 hypothetical protein LOD99_4498 [Oopsacas minuta]